MPLSVVTTHPRNLDSVDRRTFSDLTSSGFFPRRSSSILFSMVVDLCVCLSSLLFVMLQWDWREVTSCLLPHSGFQSYLRSPGRLSKVVQCWPPRGSQVGNPRPRTNKEGRKASSSRTSTGIDLSLSLSLTKENSIKNRFVRVFVSS